MRGDGGARTRRRLKPEKWRGRLMHPSALVKWRFQRRPFGIHQNRYRLSCSALPLSPVLSHNNSLGIHKDGKLLHDSNFFDMTNTM